MLDRLRNTGETAGDGRQMEAWILAVRSMLEGRLELVFEQAVDLGNRYLQAVNAEHQGFGSNRRHALQVRVWRRGYAIALEWYRIEWQGANGQEQRLRRSGRRAGDAGEQTDAQGSFCRVEDLFPPASG